MERSDFGIPSAERYFEDYIPGTVYRFGPSVVTQEEMLRFGKLYDPQVFHTNPEGARETLFGRLVASGWMTGAMAMRLLVDNYLPHRAGKGSPGLDEIRWPKPVYEGDKLWIRISIITTTRSRSKPDRGVVRSFVEVINEDQDVVMSWKGMHIVLLRDSKST